MALLLLFTISLFSGRLLADEGADWLLRVDEAANWASDAHVVMEISMWDSRGRSVERSIEIWQKGSDKRLVRLVAPPRLAGVGLLMGADDSLHLYLPSYDRTRRIVGSQRGDAFMGTDISMEDLSRTTFHDDFTATVQEQTQDRVCLLLSPRDPQAHDYHHSLLCLRSADALWTSLEYMDQQGALLRKITMSDFRTVSQHDFAHHVQVEDLEHGRTTEAQAVLVEFNLGLDDELFTLTNLSRF